MAEAFRATSETLGTLLGGMARETVVVPFFQRGYMWQEKHIEAFWKDILKQKDLSKLKNGLDKHFLGPIVTQWKPDKAQILLLDGQQRFATATILFSVMRDLAREIGKKTGVQAATDFAPLIQAQLIKREDIGYSLTLGETDATYFRQTIQEDPPDPTVRARIRTHRNIQKARKVLMEKVKTLTGEITSDTDALRAIDELKELKQTMVNDLIMARIPVESQRQAFRIFETLNDRGLRLSVPDLLLNYLMSEAPDDDHKEIRDLWTEMVERMGDNDIDDFFRHMWVSSYGDLKTDLFAALQAFIEDRKIRSIDFVRLCAFECDNYVQIINAEEEHLGKDVVRFVHSLVNDLKIPSTIPLLLSAYLLLSPNYFSDVVKWLLVFVTRYSVIGNLNTTSMENLLFSLAREVRSKMRATKLGSSEHKVASRQCAKYVKEILTKHAPDDDAIKNRIPDLHLNPSKAKYIVNRIAQYIQDPSKETKLGETNVEHIYPHNPDPGTWGGEANQEIMEPETWHLGNLTIFGKRRNRKVGNQEFPEKKVRYANSNVIMTKNIAKNYMDWNVKTIEDHARKMTKDILAIWNFDNPSRV